MERCPFYMPRAQSAESVVVRTKQYHPNETDTVRSPSIREIRKSVDPETRLRAYGVYYHTREIVCTVPDQTFFSFQVPRLKSSPATTASVEKAAVIAQNTPSGPKAKR